MKDNWERKMNNLLYNLAIPHIVIGKIELLFQEALTNQKAEFIKIIDKHADPLYFRTFDCTNLDVEPPTTEKGMRWEESKKIFMKNVKAELERRG